MATIKPIEYKFSDKSFLIRSYKEGDEIQAEDFAFQVAKETTHTLKFENMNSIPPDKLRQSWTDTNNHPVNLNLGVFYDGKIIGNIKFFQRNPSHPWVKHIAAFGMAVRKEFWGMGIGSKLLEISENHASECGIVKIEAEVRCENERGVNFYKQAGFEIEGTRKKAALIDNKYRDEFYISKFLT